ncbi:MAG: hypothetical protein KAS05_01070 [Candidatus Omnitrophica bacterium]|nr:hypothetical protein [Candidatus Omnitrophota bacterium]
MAIHIKDLVGRFLAEKKEEYKEKEKIQQVIEKIVDLDLQGSVCVKGVCKDEIILYSPSSSFSYDFKLKKEKILAGIRKEFPSIKNIKIEIG